MGLLEGSSVYLIGAVDHAEDPRKWRRDIANELLLPMDVKVYDPLVKPSWLGSETSVNGTKPVDDFKLFKDFLNNPGRFSKSEAEVIKYRMKYIRRYCLRMATSCDFIIGSLPKRFTVGTLEELKVATDAGKPVFLHLPDGMDTSTWLPAQIDNFYENSFTTMDELYDRVRSIDSGDAEVDNLEWIFLSYFNNKDIKDEFANYQQVGGQLTRR